MYIVRFGIFINASVTLGLHPMLFGKNVLLRQKLTKASYFIQLLLSLINQQWYSFRYVAYETIDRADVDNNSNKRDSQQDSQGGSKENDERRAAPSTA